MVLPRLRLQCPGDEIGDTSSSYPITITPKATVNAAGYISTISDGTAVTKYIQTRRARVFPQAAEQTITPSTNKLLHSVVVAAVSLTGNASEGGCTGRENILLKQPDEKNRHSDYPVHLFDVGSADNSVGGGSWHRI